MATSPDSTNSQPILGNTTHQEDFHQALSLISDVSTSLNNATSGLSSIEKDTVSDWMQKSAINLNPLVPVTKLSTPTSTGGINESTFIRKELTVLNPPIVSRGIIYHQALIVSIPSAYSVDSAFAPIYKGTTINALGKATSLKTSYTNEGTRQDFEYGIIFGTPKGSIAVTGDLGKYYLKNVKSFSDLGLPTASTINLAGGKQQQDFQKGSLFKSSVGIFAVKGAVLTNYLTQGGQNGVLGIPTGKEISLGVGLSRQDFNSGQIFSTPTGLFTVKGDLGKYFRKLPAKDSNALGMPITNIFSVDGGNSRQFFQGGSIEWNSGTKTGEVKLTPYSIGFDGKKLNSAIITEFNKVGGWKALGTSQDKTHRVAAGAVQSFKGGSESTAYLTIADGSKAAFLVGGSIAARYDRPDPILPNQAPVKPLELAIQNFGYATSDRYQFAGGTRQDFQQGIIFVRKKEAIAVTGDIFTQYLKTANSATVLGLATGESIDIPEGKRQDFEKGSIFDLADGTFAVTGAIGTEYLTQASVLGAPTGDATAAVDGKSRQDFKNGSIFTSSIGTFTVAGDLTEIYLTKASVLGSPTANAIDLPNGNGQRQDFEHGSMFVMANGAFTVTGAIQTEYLSQFSLLGTPKNDATAPVDGKSHQDFEHGSIFTSLVGTFTVAGHITDAYIEQANVLGAPTGKEIDLADGARQDFEHGSIFASETATFSVIGAIGAEYLKQATELGSPTGNATIPVDGKSRQDFENGSIFTSPSGTFTAIGEDTIVGTFHVNGEIKAVYLPQASLLGTPKGEVVEIPGGKRQDFQNGSIFSLVAGTFTVSGAIGTAYLLQSSVLGAPKGNAIEIAGVKHQDFQTGSIFTSPAGTFTLAGVIATAYLSQATLGAPKGDVVKLAGGNERQDFTQGSIFHIGSGTFTLQGALNNVYNGLSAAERDRLGLPTAEQINTGGYLHQSFQNGELQFVPGQQPVKWADEALINDQYNQLGGVTALGKPVGNLRNVNGTVIQDFEQGSIFATGGKTLVTKGSIGSYYRSKGSSLGLALGEEIATPSVTRQDFQNGSIFASATGTFTVSGAIGTIYLPQASALGAPKGEAVEIAGGKRQDFQTGSIFTSSAGTFTVSGAIGAAYLLQASGLGTPKGNAIEIAGGKRQDFQTGSIFTSSAGTFTVAGVIATAYLPQVTILGTPKGDVVKLTGGNEKQDFAQGSIFHIGSSTFTLQGALNTVYSGLSPADRDRLGLPTAEQTNTGGLHQSFQNGDLQSLPGQPVKWATDSRITAELNKLGGQDILGKVTGTRTVKGVTVTDFEKGSIFLTSTSVFALKGILNEMYRQQYSSIGLPLGDEKSTVNGLRQDFENGILVSTATKQTFMLKDAIANYYKGLNDPQLLSLGAPLSNATDATGGTMQYFQNGAIYNSPKGTFSIHGEIGKYVSNRSVGVPLGEEKVTSDGTIQDFSTATVIFSTKVGIKTVDGTIAKYYQSLTDAQKNQLGLPYSTVWNGTSSFQFFKGGIVDVKDGVGSVKNTPFPIGFDGINYNAKFFDKFMGIGVDLLGVPTENVVTLGDGSLRQNFQNGYILLNGSTSDVQLSPTNLGTLGQNVLHATGTVSLSLSTAYSFTVGQQSNSLILLSGLQGDAQFSLLNSQNQVMATDSNHSIQISLSPGTYTVKLTSGSFTNFTLDIQPFTTISVSQIGNYYGQHPELQSKLGSTTQGELNLGNGASRQNYQAGAIFYSPNTGVHSAQGSLGGYYLSIGGENSKFGLPTSEEAIVDGNWRQNFQNGYIEWHGDGHAYEFLNGSNPPPVGSQISNYYNQHPELQSKLGSTTQGELNLGNGASRQNYQAGAIFYSPNTGVYSAQGSLGGHYLSIGGENSKFGLPTSEEAIVDGNWRQNFQNGYIEWHGDGHAYEFLNGSSPVPPPSSKFKESVEITTNWLGSVFKWNGNDKPPADFHSGGYDSPNAVAELNLGSNTLSNGTKGISFDLGQGALRGNLPTDNFAVRAYTQADFDGGQYKFNVRGDDGFQIFAKNIVTNEWIYITPKDQWQSAYGNHVEYPVSLPQGRYDLHFHYFEGGGAANFNLDWLKVEKPDIDIQLTFIDNNFTVRQKEVIQIARNAWEFIIERDKIYSGSLKLAIAFSPNSVNTNPFAPNTLADTWRDENRGSRIDAATFDGVGGIDFNDAISFNINQYWDDDRLFRVALHEIGHTLGLQHDSENGDDIMSANIPTGYDTYISDTSYQELSNLGYQFNRNWRYR